jgi:fructokinase
MPAAGDVLTVIGEALIDLVPAPGGYLAARPGGSPFNVAIGLARLGQRTELMARLADNAFGRLLRERAEAEGIALDAAPLAAEPTTLAVVCLDQLGRASYDFYVNGTCDWQWTAAETRHAPAGTSVLHFGSLASWMSPGDAHILELTRQMRARGNVLVSYDPNVRPGPLTDPERGRAAVERAVLHAHLVKASDQDARWLYPDKTLDQAAAHWLALGATVVVITCGPDGATAFARHCEPVQVPARAATVIDTVGAGDSFTAGLLDSLVRRSLHAPPRLARAGPADLAAALADAALTAALSCERAGHDPPTLAEIESARCEPGPASQGA